MTKSRWMERRLGGDHDLTLRRSFLFYVPKKTALAFVAVGFALALLADLGAPSTVWLGPVYLFLVAFTAWTLSGFLAVGLGLLVIALTWATSGMSFYPYGSEYAFANVAIRFLCVLMIVSFLVIARRSSEREWKLARIDLLTGGLNRPAFFETIRASNYANDWCALAFADLNGLKCLNDEHGHAAGDSGIKAFADAVRNSIRKGDILARIGGDEFVVFMKIGAPKSGQLIAERLNEETNGRRPTRGALSCSWGVLLLPPGPREIDKELKTADALMYQAKKSRVGLITGVYKIDDQQITTNTNRRDHDDRGLVRTNPRPTV